MNEKFRRIKVAKHESEYDVIPQAIFWRPLKYFCTHIWRGEDGLDVFEASSFVVGNEFCFDLRKYRGHPDFTVTLYFPIEISDESVVIELINFVADEMMLPEHAIAWRRGQKFQYGELNRSTNDRLTEVEARILALKIAAQCPNQTATTQFIKQETPKYFHLTPKDLTQSLTRPAEKLWQQIMRNVTSHHKSSRSIFSLGYAKKVDKGIEVTKKGITYLKSLGFI